MSTQPISDIGSVTSATTIRCPQCGQETSFSGYKPGERLSCSTCGKPAEGPILVFTDFEPSIPPAPVKPRIEVRREGNTIIATLPSRYGGTQEVRQDCDGAVGKVSGKVCQLQPGIFEYRYYVSNDASAYGNASWVRMNIDLGDDITHEAAPNGWMAAPTRTSWLTLEAPIAPGQWAGPFTIRSTRGPGLASIVVGGSSTVLEFEDEGCPPTNLMRALVEYGGPFCDENIHSVVLTIGPTLPCSLEAVQNNIDLAAARPEFSAIAEDLLRIRRHDVNGLRVGLANIQSDSPLHQQFIKAMLMNLEPLGA